MILKVKVVHLFGRNILLYRKMPGILYNLHRASKNISHLLPWYRIIKRFMIEEKINVLTYLFTYLCIRISYYHIIVYILFYSISPYWQIALLSFKWANSYKFFLTRESFKSQRTSDIARKLHFKQAWGADQSPSCRCSDKQNGPGFSKVSLHWQTLHLFPKRLVHGRWGFFSFHCRSFFFIFPSIVKSFWLVY